MEEYPKEVRAPPLLLCSLVGAKQLHAKLTEALHESAIAACGQKRVRYLSVEYNHQVPPCRRTSQDAPGKLVAGILKMHWLEKVCNEIPAVLVVCFDWSSHTELPQTEMQQASARLLHSRRQAVFRELRMLAFAVMHPDTPDPDTACGFLRQQADLVGYVASRGLAEVQAKALKLERLVHQNATNFYADEEKRHRHVRTAAPSAPSWMSVALQVRANLKVGYCCEFRKDTRGALKSYIKAYEQLIHDEQVADVVERMGLCNHLSVRMYQLYLQSHDIGAAVHHCHIHTATLRSCRTDDQAVAWRRWSWLASNHQLFAELLESVVQQLPLLIDPADMWQFPGFHYQTAASYATRLRRWAHGVLDEASAECLPPCGLSGGDLKPSPYIGQAPLLERPGDCEDPTREVALRQARQEALAAQGGDRSVQLLTRAQAACKERGYSAGAVACKVRMAGEYLGDGSTAAARKLYERLLQPQVGADGDSGPERPIWPAVRRHALERSILCSCRELGLTEVPGICRRSWVPAPPSDQEAKPQVTGEAATEVAKTLVGDAFSYLSIMADKLESGMGADEESGAVAAAAVAELGAQQSELLRMVLAALTRAGLVESGAGVAEQPPLLEVSFDAAYATVEFKGLEEEEGPDLVIKLRSPLHVAVKVGSAVAMTSLGDVPLSAIGIVDVDDSTMLWQQRQDLKLHGYWRSLDSAAAARAPTVAAASGIHVASLRLAWAAAPCVALLVRDLRPPLPTGQERVRLPAFRLPAAAATAAGLLARGGSASSGAGARGQGGAANRDGVRSQPSPAPLRAVTHCPADPAAALLGEPFVLHLAVLCRRGTSASSRLPTGARLRLSCGVRAEASSAADAATTVISTGVGGPNSGASTPTAMTAAAMSCSDMSGGGDSGPRVWLVGKEAWEGAELLSPASSPFSTAGAAAEPPSGLVVAVVSEEASTPSRAKLEPAGGSLALPGGSLPPEAVPVLAKAPGGTGAAVSGRRPLGEGEAKADEELLLLVPVVARSEKPSKAVLSFTLSCHAGGGDGHGEEAPLLWTAAAPPLTLCFAPALELSFSDSEVGGHLLRRLLLRSLVHVPLDLLSAEELSPDDPSAESVGGGAAAQGQPLLGSCGRIAPHASHAMLLRSDAGASPSAAVAALRPSRVVVRFRRAEAVAAFFPWPECRGLLPSAPLAPASAELRSAVKPPPAQASMALLRVELQHCATGTVAQPLEVKVFVRRPAQGIQEVKARVVQNSELSNSPSDEYLLGGPTSTQVVLLAPDSDEERPRLPPAQLCTSFTIVPLKPGWLQVPLVQVQAGAQEASSQPSFVFIFPCGKPLLRRSNW